MLLLEGWWNNCLFWRVWQTIEDVGSAIWTSTSNCCNAWFPIKYVTWIPQMNMLATGVSGNIWCSLAWSARLLGACLIMFPFFFLRQLLYLIQESHFSPQDVLQPFLISKASWYVIDYVSILVRQLLHTHAHIQKVSFLITQLDALSLLAGFLSLHILHIQQKQKKFQFYTMVMIYMWGEWLSFLYAFFFLNAIPAMWC